MGMLLFLTLDDSLDHGNSPWCLTVNHNNWLYLSLCAVVHQATKNVVIYFPQPYIFTCYNRAGGAKGSIKGETLDDEENSDEGDEEDYTVYECHGLAPVSLLLIL